MRRDEVSDEMRGLSVKVSGRSTRRRRASHFAISGCMGNILLKMELGTWHVGDTALEDVRGAQSAEFGLPSGVLILLRKNLFAIMKSFL